MTTRHSGYVVVLSDDIREDDAEVLISAIKMLKGVSTVAPVESNPAKFIAESRRDELWRSRLLDLVSEMRTM
jgi:hypothetical protein